MTVALALLWSVLGALGFTAATWWLYVATEPLTDWIGRAFRKARYRRILKLRGYARRTHLRGQTFRSDTTWALANLLALTSSDARLNRNTDG